jgi:hypothetical protein
MANPNWLVNALRASGVIATHAHPFTLAISKLLAGVSGILHGISKEVQNRLLDGVGIRLQFGDFFRNGNVQLESLLGEYHGITPA